MLVFFFPFFENLPTYVYDSMRARTVLFFERHHVSSALRFLYGMRLPARARGRPRRLGCSRSTLRQRRKWTNVVWPIKSRPTNQQTDTHCSFIGIDFGTKVVLTNLGGWSGSVITTVHVRTMTRIDFLRNFCGVWHMRNV